MKLVKILICLCACLFVWSGVTPAQGVGSSGSITGTVTDSSGAVITNATVTATDPQRGARRTSSTDSAGRYEINGLPVTTYSISAEHDGFQTAIMKNVILTVGQTLTLDFSLQVSQVTSTIEVTTEAPLVETERGSQADTITGRYIQDLPINRRDYLTFTLLSPGVSDSTRMASDQDFRVKQTPQSGLSFYGSNGRGNSVTVDGGEANDDAGGVRLTLSQDAVQEFQVNRSNYAADLGGASGATINIVSKTGSNDLHFNLFAYFRNDALDARDRFAMSQALQPGEPFSLTAMGVPIKNSLNRQQFGGNAGFPVSKDKSFLYVAYEGLLSDAQDSVPLLTNSSIFAGPNPLATSNPFLQSDPRNAQQAIVTALATDPGNPTVPCLNSPGGIVPLPAQTCAGALGLGLTVSPATGLPG